MPLVGDNEDVGATTTVGRVKENARRIEPALLVVEEAGFIICAFRISQSLKTDRIAAPAVFCLAS